MSYHSHHYHISWVHNHHFVCVCQVHVGYIMWAFFHSTEYSVTFTFSFCSRNIAYSIHFCIAIREWVYRLIILARVSLYVYSLGYENTGSYEKYINKQWYPISQDFKTFDCYLCQNVSFFWNEPWTKLAIYANVLYAL